MLDTIIVYTFVLFSLFTLAVVAYRPMTSPNRQVRFFSWEIFLMLFIFTFVFGLRYDVGIDYTSYADFYNHPSSRRDDLGFLFLCISDVMYYLEIPQWVFFSLWSFLQFLFLLLAFKDKRFLLPALIIVFICGQYFMLWMNVIRQDLVACIFIYSLQFIIDKRPLKFLFWIFLAANLHHTAIVLVLFYPLFNLCKDYTKHLFVVIQLAIILFSAYIYATNVNILGGMDDLLALYLSDTEFEEYTHGVISHTTTDSVLGITFISSFIIDLIIISYSKKMKTYYKSDFFYISYNLYFWGAVLGLLLGNSFILLRAVRYFRFFKMIAAAHLMYYLFKKFRLNLWNVTSFIIMIIMYILQYVALFLYSADQKYQYHFIFFQ